MVPPGAAGPEIEDAVAPVADVVEVAEHAVVFVVLASVA